MSTQDIAVRFARETAEHEMTILHDDGAYRHVAFHNREHAWNMWFELITVPGALIFQGDIGGGYSFRRTHDMFGFFRGSAHQGRPNVHYWAEKLPEGRDSVKVFSAATFEQVVKEQFVDTARWGGVPAGTGRALREEVLRWADEMSDRDAHDAIERFEHKGFAFSDTWEWDFRDYCPRFLWACEAIVWGIAQYDAHTALPRPITNATPARLRKAVRLKCTPLPVLAVNEQPTPSTTRPALPRMHRGRPVVDVQLPEPTEVPA